MSQSITGNPILDFTLVQSLSIFYLSEATLPMVKWQTSEDPLIRGLPCPPVVALYEKAAGRKLGMLPHTDRPSMKATGYSIQVLSRLSEILPKFVTEEQSFLAKPSYRQEWSAIAGLQLQFCLEYVAETPCSIEEISTVLEGGSTFLQTSPAQKSASDFDPEIRRLYDKIAGDTDISNIRTMDLAHAALAASVRDTQNGGHGRGSFLSATSLEILSRRSRSGLFHYGPDGSASAPMGQQFYILNALLRSFPFVNLETVLEEIFHLFSNLYNIAYQQAFNLFTFKKKAISYTAFEIGSVLSCLEEISRYSGETEQKAVIDRIRNTFLDHMIQSYAPIHEKEIRKLLRWIYLSREGRVSMKEKPVVLTLFPKRLQLRYPGPVPDWSRKNIINQAELLFLCHSLLSIPETNAQEKAAFSMKLDSPALEALRSLMELLRSD